jgi:hypothetical protein
MTVGELIKELEKFDRGAAVTLYRNRYCSELLVHNEPGTCTMIMEVSDD